MRAQRRSVPAFLSICLTLLALTSAYGQGGADSQSAGGRSPEGGRNLGSEATDPTAALASFTLAEVWTANHWGNSEDGYALRFRPVVPFTAWGVANLLRISLTFDHGGIPGYGLQDVQVFDLMTFPMRGGKFAIGPLINLSAAGSGTPSPFAIGPAVGYVRSANRLNYGAFTQNLFGDGMGTSQFQPVLTRQMGKGVDLGAGDLQFTYDWERETWTSVPLGIQAGLLTKAGRQPMRVFVNPQYNFRELPGAPKASVQLGAVLLLP